MQLKLAASHHAGAAPNLALWDTSTPLADPLNIADRTAWTAVPSDLLRLEADPPKARSDPGYYGREYAFKGDAIVESPSLAVVFWSAEGRVLIYAKEDTARPNGGAQPNRGLGKKLAEIYPLEGKAKRMTISQLTVLHRTGDELALAARFSAEGTADLLETFVFDRTGIVEVKPAQNSKGIGVSSRMAYGIVPSFIGDDLIYNATDYSAANALTIPAENIFLGLIRGEEDELVLTWPKGKQQMTLQVGNDASGERVIESVEFVNDGRSLYLAALGAPGIWHKEALKPSYLEKDVTIQWRKPFPAKWKTELDEAGVKTTFNFQETKQDIWRGVPGSYTYPVWFTGDAANYHLSKKVPPRGESLIYSVEPDNDTAPARSTPADILKATLGRSESETILDLDGRQLRTHHRRGGEGVRRACTCGCTEAIEAVFTAHQEVAKKEYVAGAVADMIYFVHRHVERIDRYREFVDQLIPFLEANETSSPDLKPYLDNLEQIARRIPKEYRVQEDNMKSFEYADNLARQTIALTLTQDTNHLKTCLDLGAAWREMGGAQDYVLAQCHAITRKLCQEAGYGCVNQPKAAALAEEIRTRCRQCLRNPDGYEIWADY
ncbi:hypothetical protein SBV1_1620004 [Verrucomicrobia bacterium]|nr:hypothetical protein SBV1_1620004 [Verrucomicrobiota bacterium]